MREMNLRPFKAGDAEQLELWRREYWDGDLELPKGFMADGVETAIAEDNDEMITSLTATLAVVIDPAIRNPDASNLKVMRALQALEKVLTYTAHRAGAVDSFIAAPKHLAQWIEILKKNGYEVTAEHCVILRRPLNPDTHSLLGPERDAAITDSNNVK